MRRMIDVTGQRRARQLAYNKEHGITPTSIQKSIQEGLVIEAQSQDIESLVARESGADYDVHATLREMEAEMIEAADSLEFERAAMLRDQIKELRSASGIQGDEPKSTASTKPKKYKKFRY
jgi:excinuclease ABC subunit B